MSLKLLLVLLALWLPACESQGGAAAPPHPRQRPLNGPVRGHAHAQAMLETMGNRVRTVLTGATSSRVPVGDGDEEQARRCPDHGRELLRTRPRKRITKRELKRQLEQVKAELKACQSSSATYLHVQMAENCSMHMVGDRTFFNTTDMDIDTYVFSDRPFRYAATIPTSRFNGELFDQLFADSPPNAAITFNVYDGAAENTFEGPVISILLASTSFEMDSDNSTRVQYEVMQSADQEAILPLSRFFENGSDSVVFEQCSVFIDGGTFIA